MPANRQDSPENLGPTLSENVWDNAPDVVLIPYIDATQRANLINRRVIVQLTGMDYESNGRFGPKFIATFLIGDDAYHYSISSSGGKSPRDLLNKYLYNQVRAGAVPIPCQLVRKGSAYMFAKPGTDTDPDDASPFSDDPSFDVSGVSEKLPF
jgi:hypothetical protein